MLMCDKHDSWAVACVLCRDPRLTLMFSGLCKKHLFRRKVKFGVKLFQTKLLSRLSHKVCRLLSSPVLFCKFA